VAVTGKKIAKYHLEKGIVNGGRCWKNERRYSGSTKETFLRRPLCYRGEGGSGEGKFDGRQPEPSLREASTGGEGKRRGTAKMVVGASKG